VPHSFHRSRTCLLLFCYWSLSTGRPCSKPLQNSLYGNVKLDASKTVGPGPRFVPHWGAQSCSSYGPPNRMGRGYHSPVPHPSTSWTHRSRRLQTLISPNANLPSLRPRGLLPQSSNVAVSVGQFCRSARGQQSMIPPSRCHYDFCLSDSQ